MSIAKHLLAPSRRQALKALSALGVVVTAYPMAGRAQDGEHPTFFGWNGYDDENLFPAYLERYGTPPNFSFWGDEEEALAKMRAGYNPDVIFPCNYKIEKWFNAGILDPIDTSLLSNWPDVMESMRAVPGSVVDGQRYWVPIDWGQTSITYRTDLAPEYVGNETWEMLWDEKYQGRLAVFDSLVDGVVIAGIVEGMEDPFDYSSQEALDAIRPRLQALTANIRYYSNDVTTLEQGIASGELVAATTWNESVVRLKEMGLPIAYMNPKEGAMTWVCGLSIVAGTPFREKVHELIDAFLDPRSRAWEIENFGYGAATKSAFDLVDEETLASLGLSKNPEEILSAGIYQLSIKGQTELQALFEEVKAGY